MSMPAMLPPAAPDRKIRVMVVDDAVVFRGLVARWLAHEPDIEVVSAHRNGHEAVENFSRADPDVVILDIEMPVLDGLAALPLLLTKKRGLTVIIASTVTRRNAEVGLRALALGAADYVSKPETSRELTTSPEFRRDLVQRIRALGRRMLERAGQALPPPAGIATPAPAARGAIKLRPFSPARPRILAFGCSTGGPQALQTVMRGLEPVLRELPVVIAQHMPPTFTTILAEHIARATGRPAHEGMHGETLSPGTVYVAPGAHHMLVARTGDQAKLVVNDDPPVHFCRPAVDPLFASAAAAFGAATLAVVLTGMGSDGAGGAAAVAAAGGTVLAQDEESSVVWGMPGAAAAAGACAGVLPLGEIAPRIVGLLSGGRP